MYNVELRILKIIYHNDNFMICKCEVISEKDIEELGNEIIIKGDLGYLQEYQIYKFDLTSLYDEKYGLQYKAVLSLLNVDILESIDANTNLSILKTITTDTQAHNIHKAYPNFVQLVLLGKEQEINLSKIYNVGKEYFKVYIQRIQKNYGKIILNTKFSEYKFTDEETKKLLSLYNNQLALVIQDIEDYPYKILIGNLHRKFQTWDDKILIKHPNLKVTIQRCEFFIYDFLQRYTQSGNTRIKNLDLAEIVIENCPELTELIAETLDKAESLYYNNSNGWVSISKDYATELILSQYIDGLLTSPNNIVLDHKIECEKYRNYSEISLTDEQLNILELALDNNIVILTGAAGTGKSESLNALVKLLQDECLDVTLLAPTGIAAKRLADATHYEAYTIHYYAFTNDVITTNYCIIDEVSMLSLEHISLLLSLLSTSTKLILVGDPAQLSAIGKGNILYDLLKSKQIPQVNLTKVFRYGINSIYTVATDIRFHKEYLQSSSQFEYSDGKYTFIPIDLDPLSQVLNCYNSLLYEYKPQDILVLTPYNIGDIGTITINECIQYQLATQNNETIVQLDKEHSFAVKDKVIHVKNRYDGENSVFNGEIGTIREITDDKLIKVQYDNKIIEYTPKDYKELRLAYAVSIHKSQGTQAKAIIVITTIIHSNLLSSNLLYTAITRAQEKVVHFGEQELINSIVHKEETKNKETWLYDLLLRGETNGKNFD